MHQDGEDHAAESGQVTTARSVPQRVSSAALEPTPHNGMRIDGRNEIDIILGSQHRLIGRALDMLLNQVSEQLHSIPSQSGLVAHELVIIGHGSSGLQHTVSRRMRQIRLQCNILASSPGFLVAELTWPQQALLMADQCHGFDLVASC